MARAASRLSLAFTTTGWAASTTGEDLQAAKQTGYSFETPREIKLLPRTHEDQKKKKKKFTSTQRWLELLGQSLSLTGSAWECCLLLISNTPQLGNTSLKLWGCPTLNVHLRN